jgi:pyruvate/2-oxoglutarate dehydrogenase complex dihydrolipoamide acyltransferase (E2) component
MIRPRSLFVLAILALTITSFAAQRRTTKKKPAPPPPPAPPTLQSCGISVHIPPGWELMRLTEYEAKHPESAPEAPSKAVPESADANSAQQPEPPSQPAEAPSQPAPEASANPAAKTGPTQIAPPENPCSFVLAPRYPSELVRNTDAEGPVGRMELEIVAADLDTAAAQLFEKDEKGWYASGPKGTRYEAKLTKPKRGPQVLSAVIVEACHDLSGKYRGLCESNRYVYSNGRRSALISAGPYLGETEFTILNSIRFAPIAPAARTRKKK